MNEARRERQKAKKKKARLWKATNKALGISEGTSFSPITKVTAKRTEPRRSKRKGEFHGRLLSAGKAKGRGEYTPIPRSHRIGCNSLTRKDADAWYPEHKAIKKVWNGSEYVPA